MEMQTHRSVFILLDLSKKKKRLLEVFLGHGGELERAGSSSQLSSVQQLASGGFDNGQRTGSPVVGNGHQHRWCDSDGDGDVGPTRDWIPSPFSSHAGGCGCVGRPGQIEGRAGAP